LRVYKNSGAFNKRPVDIIAIEFIYLHYCCSFFFRIDVRKRPIDTDGIIENRSKFSSGSGRVVVVVGTTGVYLE